MKYLVLVGDGMADWPSAPISSNLPERPPLAEETAEEAGSLGKPLEPIRIPPRRPPRTVKAEEQEGFPHRQLKGSGGRTPLQVARTPHMDRIAQRGVTGSVMTIPEGYDPGSDVANLSLLGYDPRIYYTGRAPLEAASLGVDLGPEEMAFRCNLVTLEATERSLMMRDFSAGHIPTDQARQLILELDRELGGEDIRFYPGTSYRHLMVWRGGKDRCRDLKLTPPHDISGQEIGPYLPQGKEAGALLQWMTSSQMILKVHPLNRQREEEGHLPANSTWLWGQGWRPQLPRFQEKYGLRGAMISAVDLLKGLGTYLGLEIVRVPGATGYLDTNYRGKIEHALEQLEEKDYVFLHVEAPDEAAHEGSWEKKVRALEDFDAQVIGPALEGMERFGEYRVLLVTDHATPLAIRTHAAGAVPFAICGSGLEPDGATEYDESLVQKGSRHFEGGAELMEYFLTDFLD